MKYPDFSDASCKGMDINEFYFIEAEGQGNRKLRTKEQIQNLRLLCGGCPIRETCLNWGLHHEIHGWWGGTTEKERAALRVKLNITFENTNNMAGLWDAK